MRGEKKREREMMEGLYRLHLLVIFTIAQCWGLEPTPLACEAGMLQVGLYGMPWNTFSELQHLITYVLNF